MLGGVQVYNIKNGSWGSSSPLPSPRKQVAVAFLAPHIYCVGGVDGNGGDLSEVHVLNPVTQVWSQVASLNTCKG